MVEGLATFVRIAGDGMIHDGPCIVKAVVFWPDADTDYVDVYDGRDTTSGKKFCRIETATQTTRSISFGSGVLFGKGIYVDGVDAAVETTVVYVPLTPQPAAA